MYALAGHDDSEYDPDVSAHTDDGPECDLFSINTSDGSVTSMVIDGLDLDNVWNMSCHGKYVYIVTCDVTCDVVCLQVCG